jgi:hypothetical protein
MLTKIPTVSAPADSLSVEADRLIDGSINWFSDWPTADVPRSGAVVYTIKSRERSFIYVAMSGRSFIGGTSYGSPVKMEGQSLG